MREKRLADVVQQNSTNVNVLRFMAAIMVIVSHAPTLTTGETELLYQYTIGACSFGGLSVAVFFMISGLYVAKSMQGSHNFWEFMKKRCARIFPSLWIVIILTVLVGDIVVGTNGGDMAAYWKNPATYRYFLNGLLIPVHNLPGVFEESLITTVNGPLWTLPVEFAAYVILGLVGVFARRVTKSSGTCRRLYALGASVLTIVMMYCDYIDYEFGVSVIRPLAIFYMGAMYYELRDRIKLYTHYAIAALIVLASSGRIYFMSISVFSLALVILMPYVVVVLFLGTKQMPFRTKMWKISYEMYLVGFPIQQLMAWAWYYEMPAYINVVLSVPLDLLVAHTLYEVMEYVTRHRKRRKESVQTNAL